MADHPGRQLLALPSYCQVQPWEQNGAELLCSAVLLQHRPAEKLGTVGLQGCAEIWQHERFLLCRLCSHSQVLTTTVF